MKKSLKILQNRLLYLTERELVSPEDVVKKFHTEYDINELRTIMREFYLAWVSDSQSNPFARGLAEMLCFYIDLGKLIDSTYMISLDLETCVADPKQLSFW